MKSDLAAVELLLTECFASFEALPGAEPLCVAGAKGVITKLPLTFFNGVGAAVDADVDEVIAAYRAKGKPFRWWLTPSMRPDNLAALLLEKGLRHKYDSGGMALDLGRSSFTPRTIDNFVVRRIDNMADMDSWWRVLVDGFNLPHDDKRHWLSVWEHFGLAEDAEWTHFVGYLHGTPVSTTTLLLRGELAGIYHVVTVPEARGRGIGANTTNAALDLARARGAKVAVLQSSEMGAPVYRTLGFVEYCALLMYAFE